MQHKKNDAVEIYLLIQEAFVTGKIYRKLKNE